MTMTSTSMRLASQPASTLAHIIVIHTSSPNLYKIAGSAWMAEDIYGDCVYR